MLGFLGGLHGCGFGLSAWGRLSEGLEEKVGQRLQKRRLLGRHGRRFRLRRAAQRELGWVVPLVSYGLSSVTGELDDEGEGCLAVRLASTSVRSLRAAMLTAGGPGVIAAHAASSHIQAGSSRRTPMRSSTSRRSAALRVVRCPTRRRRP